MTEAALDFDIRSGIVSFGRPVLVVRLAGRDGEFRGHAHHEAIGAARGCRAPE